jgi:8-oxo-dGTP pyrophosphatase MutT (NUDIX family)
MDKSEAAINFAKDRGLRQTPRQELMSWRASGRAVVAAVCYRLQANGEVEFLLVRTRAGRWTFPKGGVDGDRTAAIAAAREAREEAGVRGPVEALAFTWYLHYKSENEVHSVNAHLCRVVHVETPDELFRTPRWFSAERAKRRLREERPSLFGDELERVVDRAVLRIESGVLPADFAILN